MEILDKFQIETLLHSLLLLFSDILQILIMIKFKFLKQKNKLLIFLIKFRINMIYMQIMLDQTFLKEHYKIMLYQTYLYILVLDCLN